MNRQIRSATASGIRTFEPQTSSTTVIRTSPEIRNALMRCREGASLRPRSNWARPVDQYRSSRCYLISRPVSSPKCAGPPMTHESVCRKVAVQRKGGIHAKAYLGAGRRLDIDRHWLHGDGGQSCTSDSGDGTAIDRRQRALAAESDPARAPHRAPRNPACPPRGTPRAARFAPLAVVAARTHGLRADVKPSRERRP